MDTVQEIDNKIKKIQQSIHDNNDYDNKIKTSYIYDLFDVRKKNTYNNPDVTTFEMINKKEEKYMLTVNNMNESIPQNVFVFIGHGWNTKKTFNIKDYVNFHVLMYDRQECLTFKEDKGGFQPIDILKYSNINQTKLQTFIELNKSAAEYSAGITDYIHFDSNVNNDVPDMLITLHGKGSEQNIFTEIGENSELNTNVMLLSELVKSISEQRSSENNILQIITCRKNITFDQEKYISRSFVKPDIPPSLGFGGKTPSRKPSDLIIIDVNDQKSKYEGVSPGKDILLKIKDANLLVRGDLPIDPPSSPFYI